MYIKIKKILDYFFVVITAPIIFFIIFLFSFLIKISNPKENIFFIQERVGYNGKVFKIFKFRTMYSSTENNTFTSSDDPRIDKLGKFLRISRIDEVPQFINILLGHMSLIGPRPEQVHFVKKLTDQYGDKFNTRQKVFPGITGLSQVEYGYVSDFDAYKKKLDYDIYYVENMNLWMDIKIFIKTFGVLLKMYGSR